MVTIDLPKSQYRRIGEKPPSRWRWINPPRWAWIDWVIVVSLLLLFLLALVGGGPRNCLRWRGEPCALVCRDGLAAPWLACIALADLGY
jgi:hypothetical protein